MKGGRWLQLILVTAAVLLGSSNARACVCGPTPPLAELYDDYDLVFLGEITNVRPVPFEPAHNEETDFTIYVDVVASYKGSVPAEVTGTGRYFYHSPFEDAQLEDSCGPAFTVGLRYLIFIYSGEVPEFAACSKMVLKATGASVDQMKALVR